MKISVIIPCRNEKPHVVQFLDTVLGQDLDPGWQLEVIVADGLSDDGTREVLRQYGHVRIIDNPGRIVSAGHQEHPDRFVRRPPKPISLPSEVWINKPVTSGEKTDEGSQ